MKTGNNVPAASHRRPRTRARVRDDSQRQLREVEELVARLQLVTEQLQSPDRPASDNAPYMLARRDQTMRDQAMMSEPAETEAR